MRKLVVAMLAGLSACNTAPAAVPVAPAVGSCLRATLDRFAGQLVTSELGARMLRETGRTAIRWVRPGMAVTMEYREDRLTVYVDAANRVERASCS